MHFLNHQLFSRIILFACIGLLVVLAYISFFGELGAYTLKTGSAEIQGDVVDFPITKSGSTRVTLNLSSGDKVLIFLPLATMVHFGDRIVVKGKIQNADSVQPSDYASYLRGKNINAVMYGASLVNITKGSSQNLFIILAQLREYAQNTIMYFLHGSVGEVVSAMAIGTNMSSAINQLFARAGILHIVAISGMNIVMIMEALLVFFLLCGMRRQTGIIASLAVIFAFIFLAGFSSSVVRAGVMGSMLYVAQLFGRPVSSLRLLLYAAVTMLVWNPFLLAGDVGFQLSFAAMAGIIILAPFVNDELRRLFERRVRDIDSYTKKPNWLAYLWQGARGIIAMSLAATLFTMPISIYHFGLFSVIGLALNIIAVPLLPIILILVFFMIILGSVHAFLGMIVSWPVWLIVSLLYGVASFAGSLPLATISLPAKSLFFFVVGYFFVGFVIFVASRKGYHPLRASSTYFYFD
ncbi:MAG: ComEC/Rec2 family competence protein [Candidatus Spechtbacteria bacterium]|nr:ComEC/Rec2 family competence protein [Candidatus Spechtbacteria bacterium]